MPSYTVFELALNATPATPTTGRRWLVGPSPTGQWLTDSAANLLAFWDGAQWTYQTPADGDQLFVQSGTYAGMHVSIVSTAWFPLQPVSIATEHWTGRYALNGSSEKIYSKSLTGSLLDHTPGSGTPGPNQDVTHSASLDLTTGTCTVRAIISGSSLGFVAPQFLSGSPLEAKLGATVVTLVYANQDLSAYDYVLTLEYTK